MTSDYDIEHDDFRLHVRSWIAANFPPVLAGHGPVPFHSNPDPDDVDYQLWRRRMGEQGWGVPTWPRAVGGGGLDAGQAQIIAQELAHAQAFNPIGGLGVTMFGPTLLEYGTPEQIAAHIPPIARGDLRWCQGFSEPGAGSDLASLKTRCDDLGDHWLVNGQKVWTSGANLSDWCFCLVRTDTSRKQDGITFLMIDMRSPGIEARTIELINGVTHFCEVFLTDVRVPKANTVGPVNGGWSVAKRLLQHERTGLAADRAAPASLAPVAHAYVGTDAQGRIANPDLRARLIIQAARSRAYTLTLTRIAAERKAGMPSVAVSVLKNFGATVSQARAELHVEILGANGTGWDGDGFTPDEVDVTSMWLHSKCFSIYGGSHEVQNNITAKRVLGLPAK